MRRLDELPHELLKMILEDVKDYDSLCSLRCTSKIFKLIIDRYDELYTEEVLKSISSFATDEPCDYKDINQTACIYKNAAKRIVHARKNLTRLSLEFIGSKGIRRKSPWYNKPHVGEIDRIFKSYNREYLIRESPIQRIVTNKEEKLNNGLIRVGQLPEWEDALNHEQRPSFLELDLNNQCFAIKSEEFYDVEETVICKNMHEVVERTIKSYKNCSKDEINEKVFVYKIHNCIFSTSIIKNGPKDLVILIDNTNTLAVCKHGHVALIRVFKDLTDGDQPPQYLIYPTNDDMTTEERQLLASTRPIPTPMGFLLNVTRNNNNFEGEIGSITRHYIIKHFDGSKVDITPDITKVPSTNRLQTTSRQSLTNDAICSGILFFIRNDSLYSWFYPHECVKLFDFEAICGEKTFGVYSWKFSGGYYQKNGKLCIVRDAKDSSWQSFSIIIDVLNNTVNFYGTTTQREKIRLNKSMKRWKYTKNGTKLRQGVNVLYKDGTMVYWCYEAVARFGDLYRHKQYEQGTKVDLKQTNFNQTAPRTDREMLAMLPNQ